MNVEEALHSRYAAYAPDEWFTLTFRTGPSGFIENQHMQVCEVAEATKYIEQHLLTDVWSSMSVYAQELKPNLKGTEAEVSRCAWLWVDVDCHDSPGKLHAALERIKSFNTPYPTQIVFSGHGYHAYWAIEPTSDLHGVKERNRWLKYRLNGDDTENVDRILRVPYTHNLKDGGDVLCEIIEDNKRVYTFADFTAPDGYVPGMDVQSRIDVEYEPLPVDFEQKVRKLNRELWKSITETVVGKGERSGRDYYITCKLLSYNFPPGVVASVLRHPKWPSGDKGRTNHDYVELTVRAAHTEIASIPVPEIRLGDTDHPFVEGIASSEICSYFHVSGLNGAAYYYHEGKWHAGISRIVSTVLFHGLGTNIRLEYLHKTSGLVEGFAKINPVKIDDDPFWVGVEGGLLHLKTREFRASSPDLFVPINIPVQYIANARSRVLEDFVRSVVDDACVTYYEHLAYCLTSWVKMITDPRALILHGLPRRGKSELLMLARGFLGAANGSTIGIDNLTGDATYYTAGLLGKSYNMSFDADLKKKMKNPKQMKDLIMGEPMTFRRIYGDLIENAQSFAKFWVASNDLPTGIGTDDALYRRLLVIECPHEYKADTPGHRLAIGEELSKDSYIRSSLLNLALDGFERLLSQKNHTETASMVKAINTTREASSSTEAWRVECTEFSADSYILTSDVWTEYQSYCREFGLHTNAKGKFFEQLLSIGEARPEFRTFKEHKWISELKQRREVFTGFKINRSYMRTDKPSNIIHISAIGE